MIITTRDIATRNQCDINRVHYAALKAGVKADQRAGRVRLFTPEQAKQIESELRLSNASAEAVDRG